MNRWGNRSLPTTMAEKFRIRIQEKISMDCVPNIKGKTITLGCFTFYILNLCTPRLLEGLILHCFKLEIYTRKNDIAAERSLLPSSSHLDRGADAPSHGQQQLLKQHACLVRKIHKSSMSYIQMGLLIRSDMLQALELLSP